VYLGVPLEACIAELKRAAVSQAGGLASILPRELHTVSVSGLGVLDLTDSMNLALLDISATELRSDDWTLCQWIAEAAHFLGAEGIVAPSATGVGLVVAAFDDRIGGERLTVRESTVVTSLD
jgi:hypothetical protein